MLYFLQQKKGGYKKTAKSIQLFLKNKVTSQYVALQKVANTYQTFVLL